MPCVEQYLKLVHSTDRRPTTNVYTGYSFKVTFVPIYVVWFTLPVVKLTNALHYIGNTSSQIKDETSDKCWE